MRLAFMHRRLAGGGTETDLRRMALGLAERGHDVHAFVARADAALPGVTVHRVATPPGGRLVRLLGFALMAPRTVARERFDVVVGFGRTPRQDVVRVGGGTHRTYLATMVAAGRRGRFLGPYHRAILALEARMFAPTGHRRVLAVSERVADEVARDYGVPRDSIRVLYNGVDLERFHPARRVDAGRRVRARLGLGTRPVCLAVGTGFERKGFDVLLAAWRRGAPGDAALVIAGGDERLGAYRTAAAEPALAGRVHVLGPQTDVEGLFAAADVFCLPSRQEAFGNVVLEAAAAGVPIVASDAVGATELFTGSAACTIVPSPAREDALLRAVADVLGDGWPERSQEARRIAERHPWTAHLDALDAFLREVADGV